MSETVLGHYSWGYNNSYRFLCNLNYSPAAVYRLPLLFRIFVKFNDAKCPMSETVFAIIHGDIIIHNDFHAALFILTSHFENPKVVASNCMTKHFVFKNFNIQNFFCTIEIHVGCYNTRKEILLQLRYGEGFFARTYLVKRLQKISNYI